MSAELSGGKFAKFRPDIEWSRSSRTSSSVWIARDPISLEFYYFSELERRIAQSLDGRTSLREVLLLDRRISEDWLRALVAKFESACLLVPRSVNATGKYLYLAEKQRSKRASVRQILNPLVFRIKLFDPTFLLRDLGAFSRIFFRLPTVILCLTIGTFIAVSAANELVIRPLKITELAANLTPFQVAVSACVFLLVKSMHEIGHALACRRWGAECHEIGIMILVFFPYLYCDTTDAWKLDSQLKRAAIAFAGIYVELLLAALGAAIWLFAVPGSFVSVLAAQVMLFCSLNTIFVNGNPLLRYDGYYVLSDLAGVPNLGSQSSAAFRGVLVSWFNGVPITEKRWDASATFLVTYCVSAFLYRHFLSSLIAWFVWTTCNELGVALLGLVLSMIVIGNLILTDLVGSVRLTFEVFSVGKLKMLRLTSFACLVLSLGIIGYVWRVPTFVSGRGITTTQNMSPLYAQADGMVVRLLEQDATVKAGDEIVRLESPEIRQDMLLAKQRAERLKIRYEQLNRLSLEDESVSAELSNVGEELVSARLQVTKLSKSVSKLRLLAPHAGILKAARVEEKQTFSEFPGQAPSRSLLDQENIGRWIEKGTQLGWLCDNEFRLEAYVEEENLELLYPGMKVRCRWDSDSSRTYMGVVRKLHSQPATSIPETLFGDPMVPTESLGNGQYRPKGQLYRLEIEIEAKPKHTGAKSLATVHFITQPRTVFESLQRLVSQSFLPKIKASSN